MDSPSNAEEWTWEGGEDELSRIESNDPTLHKLTLSIAANGVDPKRFGAATRRSTHLRELSCTPCFTASKENLEDFFRGVASNRSLQKLRLGYFEGAPIDQPLRHVAGGREYEEVISGDMPKFGRPF
ncbi:hypothetical protein ACHAXT_006472 [Thalassiosira profunda]